MAAPKASKLRIALVILAWLLLGLFIWFAGPYFAFADWHPLEPTIARVITIAALIIVWLLVLLWRRSREEKKSEALLGAVAKQPDPAEGTSPDAPVLRERFAEAVQLLKQTSRGKQNLYSLPWYVIIGAPGSGKTTLLVNSGLRMPLAKRFGEHTVTGVGGTRNCDWLFTDEAVFIDTAGRYLTQDSDSAADAAGWKEFLGLLQQYRRRRPLNGVILAVSAQDLLTLQPAEREEHIAAARRRLEELNRELRIELPVYVLVTKCDLLNGFDEYFDDQAVEGRAQVWGATFPYEATLSGDAIRAFPNEFDRLVERLNTRLLDRVETERDPRRRGTIFGFPQQMSALRALVAGYIADVFTQSRFERRSLLRGVYFTSGTQEGTPIDRLMSATGRALGLSSDVVASAPKGRGKAYFVANLLKVLLLGESGLAGVNRRLEIRKAAALAITYIAIILLAVFLLTGLFVSLDRNQKYLAQMNAQTAQLADVPGKAGDTPLESVLPRLDAFSQLFESANRYHEGTPFWMRFGLFQGHAVADAAHDAYMRELDGVLLPRVMAQLRQRLIGSATAPDQLYEYLKAYLMLGQPEHLDKPQLAAIVDLEFARAYPSDPDARQGLSKHLRALLDGEDTLRALPTDQMLVDQARNAIRQASVARLMYSRLKLNYAGDTAHALRLDVAAGLGADQVFQRRSGASLADPVPGLYTRTVFKEVVTTGTAELVKQFIADSWVLGPDSAAGALRQSAQLSKDMVELYEKDYGDQWDRILADIQLKSFSTVEAATVALGILGAPTSPLRGLLQTIDTNTHLVPGPGEAPQGAVASTQQALADRLRKLLNTGSQAVGVTPAAPPGTQVTARFAALHQSMAGPPGAAPIDRVLSLISQLQQQLLSVGNAAGERSPLDVIAQSGRGDLVKSLQSQAGLLPPAVGALVSEVGGHSEGVTFTQASGELQSRFQQLVVQDCNAALRGRYPFTPGSSLDVPPADFGRIFGYGGLYETFFKENLAALVDTTRRPWSWRSGADGASLGVSVAMLRQFEAAQQIRESFFRPGSQLPELHFTVIPVALDAAATRVLLEIDGQSFEYRHGPQTSRPASWPGPNPGAAAASFEDRSGGHPNVSFQGPWALFRLLDAAHLQSTTDVRFNMYFDMGGHVAQFALEADSIRNPFGQRQLRAFRCSP
jgi:type VI secretion system protein ImpL